MAWNDLFPQAHALAIPEQPARLELQPPPFDIIDLDALQDLHDFGDLEWPNIPPPIDDLPDLVPGEPPEMPAKLRSDAKQQSSEDQKSACEETVIACLPDICRDYVQTAAAEHNWNPEQLINHILEQQDKGTPYPKHTKTLKRKRTEEAEDAEEAIRKKFDNANPIHQPRNTPYFIQYTDAAKVLLKKQFPRLYAGDVEKLLKENNFRIYPTYLACDKATTGTGGQKLLYRLKPIIPKVSLDPETQLAEKESDGAKDAIEEYRAAKTILQVRLTKETEAKRKEQEELENMERARLDGTVFECGCCCDEFPANRMVQCNGEPFHLFCRDCARRQAESQVGLSKYELACMDTSGCTAGFDKDQKELFLDEKLSIALDRIEKEAVLRMAGIENLESCPNCPYAAEYPPKEVNKEFKCENPDCGKVICRYCRLDTHIPKTCEEAARETGHSARRLIEEAMSAALIRKCNKCSTPFIKEAGCNKMTCTRNGCHNVQCYVCSKSCDYSHFDDAGRGGKTGNCPLYDRVEERHQEEVNAAMEEARKKVAEENPDVHPELLKINFSENVNADDQLRKAGNAPPRMLAGGHRHRYRLGAFAEQLQRLQQRMAQVRDRLDPPAPPQREPWAPVRPNPIQANPGRAPDDPFAQVWAQVQAHIQPPAQALQIEAQIQAQHQAIQAEVFRFQAEMQGHFMRARRLQDQPQVQAHMGQLPLGLNPPEYRLPAMPQPFHHFPWNQPQEQNNELQPQPQQFQQLQVRPALFEQGSPFNGHPRDPVQPVNAAAAINYNNNGNNNNINNNPLALQNLDGQQEDLLVGPGFPFKTVHPNLLNLGAGEDDNNYNMGQGNVNVPRWG